MKCIVKMFRPLCTCISLSNLWIFTIQKSLPFKLQRNWVHSSGLSMVPFLQIRVQQKNTSCSISSLPHFIFSNYPLLCDLLLFSFQCIYLRNFFCIENNTGCTNISIYTVIFYTSMIPFIIFFPFIPHCFVRSFNYSKRTSFNLEQLWLWKD